MVNRTFFLLDVESIGLHGEGFAAAYLVVRDGEELESGLFACDPAFARGTDDDRKWIAKNVPALPENCESPGVVRERLWERWLHWKSLGAFMVADCAWPVEANFLAQCVRDQEHAQDFNGPYPLLDVTTLIFASGKDPTIPTERLPDELPLHDPRADCRHSKRKWLALLGRKTS
jgi:hypothetical protein